MNIAMYRVDGRMLHGQVITTFSKALSLDSYVVVNDGAAASADQKALLALAVPEGSRLEVLSCAEFARRRAQGPDFAGSQVCVVFRYIEDALACFRCGARFGKLTIGGMFQRLGRSGADNKGVALMISDIDRKAFRELSDAGIELTYQVSFFNKELPLREVVDY